MSVNNIKAFRDAEEKFSSTNPQVTRILATVTLVSQSSFGGAEYAAGKLIYSHEAQKPPRFSSSGIYLRTNPPYNAESPYDDDTEDIFKKSQKIDISIIGGDDPEAIITFPSETIKFGIDVLEGNFLINTSNPHRVTERPSETTSPSSPQIIRDPHFASGATEIVSGIQLIRRVIYIISFGEVDSMTVPK